MTHHLWIYRLQIILGCVALIFLIAGMAAMISHIRRLSWEDKMIRSSEFRRRDYLKKGRKTELASTKN